MFESCLRNNSFAIDCPPINCVFLFYSPGQCRRSLFLSPEWRHNTLHYKAKEIPSCILFAEGDFDFLRHGAITDSYATAQLTPSAVPTAARIADARFHKNLINLDLFSLVIMFFYEEIYTP